MLISFKDKCVVVAGGSRGIGRGIAEAFAAEGAHVSIAARGADDLARAADELRVHGGEVHRAALDLGEGPAVTRYIAEAAEALGGIDILVNNASGFGSSDDEAGWEAGIKVDIMATVRASHAAIPHIAERGGGAIINIASISGFGASTRTPPYAAVKAAVINYTMSQALGLAARNIRVNCIAPGSIEFPGGIWEKRRAENPKLYGAVLRSIPFGRLGTVGEIAGVALFLASEQARWITGQTVIVDGGQSLA